MSAILELEVLIAGLKGASWSQISLFEDSAGVPVFYNFCRYKDSVEQIEWSRAKQ
jgi:hypothetical protein